MLETSNQIHKLIASNKIVLDPLRLAIQFNGLQDSTIIDDFLCNQYGIYCELNQKKCITYAISPYISKNSSSLETLFSALTTCLDIDIARCKVGQGRNQHLAIPGGSEENKFSPDGDDDDDDDEIIDTSSINIQRDLSYLTVNIDRYQANRITQKISKNLINQ